MSVLKVPDSPFLAALASSEVVMSQTSLLFTFSKKGKAILWSDSLIIPVYFAIASAVVLVLHIVLFLKPVQQLWSRLRRKDFVEYPEPAPVNRPESLWAEVKQHVQNHGGATIFGFELARLVGCLALLGLSVTSLVLLEEARNPGADSWGKWGKKHKNKKPKAPAFSVNEWLHVAMCITFLYTSLLALISVTAKRGSSKIVTRHLNTVLFATLCVYAYRDLFPLATFTRPVQDISEGWLLWTTTAVLIVTSAVIPLLIPRQYVPADSKNPLEVPSPEYTASILSLALHYYLDPIVFLAYRASTLTFEQLPPLGDYDYSQLLKAKSFKYLDTFSGAKTRHLFFGLMYIFRLEYATMSLMISIYATSSFAAPIGVYGLLSYMETKGEGAVIKPWLWILWLFVGPLIGSIAMQWYIFIATRTLVRAEGIITQLVFEHALRIRVKAETTDSAKTSSNSSISISTTPDDASIVTHPSPGGSHSSGEDTSPSSATTEVDTLKSSDETVQASSASVTSSTKSKAKSNATKDADDKSEAASNLVGKINNLVTTDLNNIVEARDFLFLVLYIPVQIGLCIWFLYAILGWSALVGLAVIIIMFPVPGFVAKLVQTVQEKRLKRTDARVQSVSEAMNVLRMIKLFGWESKMNARIAEKREEELVWIKRRQFLDLLNGSLNFIIPVITMLATYGTYVSSFTRSVITVIMKEELTASKVFSSMSVFDLLRDQMHMERLIHYRQVFYCITTTMTGKVSLDRVTRFLRETELLDVFTEKNEPQLFVSEAEAPSEDIGFRNATFTWSNTSSGSQTPSGRNFTLKIEDELKFKKGKINLVIGPTGSGKTSLLMALLGEMHFIPSGPESWYNLPRSTGVAYAAQESWVQNESIRDNIVFGAEFDEARYKAVIKQCGLERDLELFDAGDRTEVGEKGLTLSGGQKSRLTLARAIYSQAQVILLDDVLAALDVHTAKYVLDHCFKGDLVKGRTIILVTHNVAMARPIAEFVVSVKEGRIHSQGSVSEIIAKDKSAALKLKEEQKTLEKADEEVDAEPETQTKKPDGKLIVAEEMAEGHVSWPAVKLYLSGLGGNHAFFFFLAYLGGLLLVDVINTMQTWFLGYWASQYEKHPASEVNVFYYITIYGCVMLAAVALYAVAFIVYVFGALRASRSIHQRLVESVMGTTLRWLDTTPTSRVITRCTQDIRAVDGPIATMLFYLSELTLEMLIKFLAVVSITPVFVGPGVLVALAGGMCGQIYIKAQLAVKREMSVAKAPVLGHFGAAIAGLTSIRAYGVQSAFKDKSLLRINKYTRAARTFYNLNRWICIRIDALGGLFAASLAAYLVYFQDQTSSTTGFSLNMAVGFSGMILWWVRMLNEFEVQGNSLERIQGYVEIEQEPKSVPEKIPPAYWPSSGDIRVEKLSARYSPEGTKVLHDLSFHIKSGERIGVVGRTGSGKSSLTLSLLRCIYTEGEVYYDNIPTSAINLDALRSNITIIPQVPELLSGTLRQNLDPFDQYDDAVLNDALRSAGLFSLQNEMDEGKITLDSSIASGGSNLSVGQRQILALSRAIVRGSKLLILDEATSAIDYKTDSIIQSSLRNELKGDITLITVAHRLQTIMDADKIMVLDAGRIVEFDSPKELLKKHDGLLRALVDESADKDILHAIAEGRKVEQTH